MTRDPTDPGRRSRGFRWALLVSMLAINVILSSCGEDPPYDPSILAVFDGGQVTIADLDHAVLALPPDERQAQLASPERLETIVRRLAFNKIMESELDESDLEENDSYPIILDAVLRRVTVGIYLRANDLQTPVGPEDISRWFDGHPELRRQPPQRIVFTFFRSFSAGDSRDPTIEAVRAVRHRIENGEPFSRVAEQESDSETRHRGGLLGTISPGQLEPALDRIITSLEEGELSEPIITKDGVHLFWVKSIVEGRELADAELRPFAIEEIAREKTDETLVRAMHELGVEEPRLPSLEELQTMTRSGDPHTVVLEVEDRAFDLIELRFLLQREEATRSADVSALLRDVARTEALRQAIEEQGLVSDEDIGRASGPAMMAERLSLHANLRTRAWLDSNENRLRRAYESEPSMYRTPLTLHVVKLTVPLGPDPMESMQRLEQRTIDADVKDLETIAAEMGGSVQDLGIADLARLVARDPGVVVVVPCASGDLTPPHRTIEGLIVYGLVERRDPEERPFDQVSQAVAEILLREQGPELQDEFSALVLEQHDFELFEERTQDPTLFSTLT